MSRLSPGAVLRAAHRASLLRPHHLLAMVGPVARHRSVLAALPELGAARFAGRTALLGPAGAVGHDELAALTLARAAALGEVDPGDRVGLAMGNDASSVATLFALLGRGARVHVVDPRLGAEGWAALVSAHRWSLVVHPGDSGPAIERHAAPGAPTGGGLGVLTGGTTGRPTAAVRSGAPGQVLAPFVALVNRVGIADHRRVFVAAPLHHGFGLSAALTGLALGITLVTPERFVAQPVADALRHTGSTALVAVPTMLRRLLDADPAALAGVRTVVSGSAPLDPGLAREVGSGGCRVFNLFGSSEAGFGVLADPSDLAEAPGTIGRPIDGVGARVVAPDGTPVGTGEVGRLELRSRTAVRSGWLATGDLAHVDGRGRLFLHGRDDDLVMVGGQTVSPLAARRVLLGHPRVAQCEVIAVTDADLGQRLVAFVVADASDASAGRDGSPLSVAELEAWLRTRLTSGERPRRVVLLAELPLTAAHKVDRQALRGLVG